MRATARCIAYAAVSLLITACSLTRGADPDAESPDVAVAGIGSTSIDAAPVASDSAGERLLALARAQLGLPYRFGGATPRGFDCSGLVRYVHGLAGLSVPRTAAGQMLAAQPVPRTALRAGDLVFFASDGVQIDHVGIYAGDGRFLHAPRSGRPVGYDRLDDAWYAPRWRAAGRFWTAGAPPGAAAPVP